MTLREALRRLRQRHFKSAGFWYARMIMLPIFKFIFGMRIEGLENIPKSGPALLISNHLHIFDPILLYAVLIRPGRFMAKKEVFTVPVIGWLTKFFDGFPVDRGSADRAALRLAEQHLANGKIVGIFPEGTRSPDATLQEAFPGVAMIAVRSGAPILPVVIFGTEKMPFNGKKGRGQTWRRPQVIVRIGHTFNLPETQPGQRRPSLPSVTSFMMTEVARLLPQEYRGVYADAVEKPEQSQKPARGTATETAAAGAAANDGTKEPSRDG